MYKLNYHLEHDAEVIEKLIADFPFAFLSGSDKNNAPVATQVPLFLDKQQGKKRLIGHFMKNTDHHRAFEHNDSALAVFTGKHCYVSGTWYSNPNTASTWNYTSVHVKGKLQFLAKKDLEEILQLTSLHFEDYREESPTVYANLPADFKARVLPMLMAFEIQIESIDAVFKLSQDRDEESYQNIIEQLSKKGPDENYIAQAMKERKAKLL